MQNIFGRLEFSDNHNIVKLQSVSLRFCNGLPGLELTVNPTMTIEKDVVRIRHKAANTSRFLLMVRRERHCRWPYAIRPAVKQNIRIRKMISRLTRAAVE
jgi:hypothetical protein